MPEETTKYQKEWNEFRTGKMVAYTIPLLVFFVLTAITVAIASLFGINDLLSKLILIPLVPTAILALWTWGRVRYWKCPRCGDLFDYTGRGWWRSCRNCKLPKYYGSSWYQDTWSPDMGREMADKIKKGEM